MIVIRLEGGLGNQMFQYAFGRALSLQNNCELFFDDSYFKNQYGDRFDNGLSRRKLELDIFSFHLSLWNNRICNFFPNNFFQKTILKIEKIVGIKSLVHETEYGFHDSYCTNIKRYTYFVGYWQSPIYFEKFRKTLLNDFIFKLPSTRNFSLEESIRKSNSISIHVRRGDYLNSIDVNSVHGLCSIEYYKNATSIISEKFINIKWFIFSDDIAWCKQNFNWLKDINLIDSNEDLAYYDMYLMSICKHNIIANSSFSWWGGWLNDNPDKIVIGPSRWFSNIELNSQFKGILPLNWLSI